MLLKTHIFKYLIFLGLLGQLWSPALVLADWHESTNSPNFCSTSNPVCNLPLSGSSLVQQVMNGSFTLKNLLWSATTTNPSNKVLVNGVVGVGAGFGSSTIAVGSPAILDVNGQIQLRAYIGSTIAESSIPAAGRVLTAIPNPIGVGYSGEAVWKDPPAGVLTLLQGLGIELHPNPPISGNLIGSTGGTVSIDSGEDGPLYTQRRVLLGCGATSTIASFSGATNVTPYCQPAVNSLNLSAGIVNSYATSTGMQAPYINVGLGTGLEWPNNSSLGVKLLNRNINFGPPTLATSSTNYLKLRDCTVTNPYLKWVNGDWSCGQFDPPLAVGDSVMYLKRTGTTAPPTCPAGWTDVGATFTETVYKDSSVTRTHTVRVCYNTTKACIVMRKEANNTGTTPVNLPCPSPFIEVQYQSEWAAGPAQSNAVRTCYYCAP